MNFVYVKSEIFSGVCEAEKHPETNKRPEKFGNEGPERGWSVDRPPSCLYRNTVSIQRGECFSNE